MHDFWGDAFYEHELQLAVAKRTLVGGRWATDIEDASPDAKPEGVEHWLALQDIRAAVELANRLAALRPRGIQVVHGDQVDLHAGNRCAIALGLGFNKLTRRFEDKFRGNLYSITFGESERRVPGLLTDNFSLPGCDAQDVRAGADKALVARIVLPADAPVGYCAYFVCAGRTAAGTVAAGWFLANRWPKLLGLYEKNRFSLTRDSVAGIVWHAENGTASGSGTRDEPAWHDDEWHCAKERAPGFDGSA